MHRRNFFILALGFALTACIPLSSAAQQTLYAGSVLNVKHITTGFTLRDKPVLNSFIIYDRKINHGSVNFGAILLKELGDERQGSLGYHSQKFADRIDLLAHWVTPVKEAFLTTGIQARIRFDESFIIGPAQLFGNGVSLLVDYTRPINRIHPRVQLAYDVIGEAGFFSKIELGYRLPVWNLTGVPLGSLLITPEYGIRFTGANFEIGGQLYEPKSAAYFATSLRFSTGFFGHAATQFAFLVESSWIRGQHEVYRISGLQDKEDNKFLLSVALLVRSKKR
ncbi:MAG: hypothetical protein AB8G77_11450 [Rhodothermales bacterium]